MNSTHWVYISESEQTEMAVANRQTVWAYLLKNYGLTDAAIEKLLDQPQVQKLLESAERVGSFDYYAGEEILREADEHGWLSPADYDPDFQAPVDCLVPYPVFMEDEDDEESEEELPEDDSDLEEDEEDDWEDDSDLEEDSDLEDDWEDDEEDDELDGDIPGELDQGNCSRSPRMVRPALLERSGYGSVLTLNFSPGQAVKIPSYLLP